MMSQRLHSIVLAVFLAITPLAAISGQEPKADKPGLPKSPMNLDFEEGEARKLPPGWFMPETCSKDGYVLEVSEAKPFAGKHCAVLSRILASAPEGFGNIIQSIDATPYRGKRIRFKAAVRAEVSKEDNDAKLWLRVDRGGDQRGFFDNMDDRPIRSNVWKHYEIIGDVADDCAASCSG